MNQLKVAVAIFGFAAAFLITEQWAQLSPLATCFLLSSGLLGLCIGDLFLFKAFAELGPSRTLVLYSFQPIFLGIYGYLFLSQSLSIPQTIAILCMIGCVCTFLLERNRKTGKWHAMSFLAAFLGIFFDAIGVMLTRSAYELTPALGSFQSNLVRASGAVLGFLIINPKSYRKVWSDLKVMNRNQRHLVIGACFFGTFVSLSLYLHALKFAHVATLTSIAITGPVWVSLIEHLRDRELPNRYLVFAFLLFLTGFALLSLG